MISGFYYRAQRTRLQEIVQPVGADGGRACTESHTGLILLPVAAVGMSGFVHGNNVFRRRVILQGVRWRKAVAAARHEDVEFLAAVGDSLRNGTGGDRPSGGNTAVERQPSIELVFQVARRHIDGFRLKRIHDTNPHFDEVLKRPAT